MGNGYHYQLCGQVEAAIAKESPSNFKTPNRSSQKMPATENSPLDRYVVLLSDLLKLVFFYFLLHLYML